MQSVVPVHKLPQMTQAPVSLADQLAALVTEYRERGQFAQLQDALRSLARTALPDAVVLAAEPYRDDPAITAPLYEVVVDAQPQNARALVILANAYWLLGAGPEAVEGLASRAISADAGNRGAWHLWALAEAEPRRRTMRWQQVYERFPTDDLALACVADNAASVAGAEQDYEMLDLAIEAYQALLDRTPDAAQREAVETALRALRGWRF
jgi:hypothetical protein